MINPTFWASVVLVLGASAAVAQVPAGVEFRVNTYSVSNQTYPRIGMGADRSFVAVWASNDEDGSGKGIFARRFDASGAPRGSVFQVNVQTSGDQGQPSVSVARGGEFVVAWATATGGYAESMHARRFQASGSPIGGEFQVNTGLVAAPYFGYRPSVGHSSDGRFIVSWVGSAATGSALVARRYEASGAPVGNEFRTNPLSNTAQWAGDVGVDGGGGFVAVWEDPIFGNGDGDGSGIMGQRFDAAGVPVGSEFVVNTTTAGNQYFPRVTVSPDGGFAATWMGPDGGGFGAFARQFDAAGVAVGPDFVVNTYTTGQQGGSQVARDAAGNLIVTWTSYEAQAFHGSFAQRFNASGKRRGGEFRVSSSTTATSFHPAVAVDAVGNFVLAWTHAEPAAPTSIVARRFGGLTPIALAVDTTGNQVFEPGETVDLRPSWANFNGAAQKVGATLSQMTGPASAVYAIDDARAAYGTVADGSSGQCTECFAISVSNAALRPAVHWDASALERIVPDAHGQEKRWRLHVGNSFSDVPVTSAYYRDIETLLHHGITAGCSLTTPDTFCPHAPATRGEMAQLLLLAKEEEGYAPPTCLGTVFADVTPQNPHCGAIEELARRGVVAGCAPTLYCPNQIVAREEIAVLLLRTLDPAINPPPCAAPTFYNDVPETHPFCPWIEELARRGVVSDCGGGNYCPSAQVTREQAAFFMASGFDLTLYGI